MAATQAIAQPERLGGRDPEFVRRALPLLWPLVEMWFRPDIRGLDLIPEIGPVLLVGNHSGGNVSPDTTAFTLAFVRRFGAERPFFQLAHDLVMAAPQLTLARRFGMVAASPANAEAAFALGAAVLVYPGGDLEVHRPVWRGHRVDLAWRAPTRRGCTWTARRT